MSSSKYQPLSPKPRWIIVLVYAIQVEKIAAKNYFISDNSLKNDRFLEFRASPDARRWNYLYNHLRVGQSARAKSTELANERAPKALFICVAYTNN